MDDLLIICPNRRWKAVLEAFLARTRHLGIREVTASIHALSVGGSRALLQTGVDLANAQADRFNHCLLILDADQAGDERDGPAIQADLSSRLSPVWEKRAAAVVSNPSLESWLLEAHRVFARIPGLRGVDVRRWLSDSGHWPMNSAQPDQARHAVKELFERHKVPLSAANYRIVAAEYPLRFDRIESPSMRRFIYQLRDWFLA
ncbi:MAG: hypothetical protein CMH52_01370 [Myxococcales bacterium]|nr:hypothetical protein [Myxococcales bacterium]|tara:strand:+ start:46 stop:654 length:609 start_codon:yes stop_codon:yes gene_type:complete